MKINDITYFQPAFGERIGNIQNVNGYTRYWTSTPSTNSDGQYAALRADADGKVAFGAQPSSNGWIVRCVPQDEKTIPAYPGIIALNANN